MKVQEYIREDGSNPYQKWFDSPDPEAAAKVTVAKTRLELGNTSNIKWFDGIGEYRIDWGPDYRIYLAQDGKQLLNLPSRDARDSHIDSYLDTRYECYVPPTDRHYWAACLTFTGAPTANGSKFYFNFWLCFQAKPNYQSRHHYNFAWRYLSRRSEVREANPLNIYCALPLFAIVQRLKLLMNEDTKSKL
ncbi:MAG: hypothetical protein QNJ32_14290 [Xenococcaceae cyanobacterium MO_167.B27]|nr:hypothetical protein [Xenococcaceae cyanobacterium MO_167.B27]